MFPSVVMCCQTGSIMTLRLCERHPFNWRFLEIRWFIVVSVVSIKFAQSSRCPKITNTQHHSNTLKNRLKLMQVFDRF